MAWKANGRSDLPLASREMAWDGTAADNRVRRWAGGPDKADINWGKYHTAFFAHDDEGGEDFGGYKLGFADIVDGALKAVPRGIFACAGGRGVNRADLPEPVKATIRGRITAYYRRMAREFEDETLHSPFEEASLSPALEHKTVTEPRSIEGRIVTGFPSVFGNVDDGGDLIEAGAYAKTLAERGTRLRWLWQHDNAQPPIAKLLDVREVGRTDLPLTLAQQFPEATGGLLVKREYLDTARGNEVLAGIQGGALSEMSIGYDAIKAEFPEGQMVAGRPVKRVLKEIRLWEMSDVLWGMNVAAQNAKRLDLDVPLEELEALLREAGRWEELAGLLKATQNVMANQTAERKRRLELLGQSLNLL